MRVPAWLALVLVVAGAVLLSLSGMLLGLWWVTFATGVAVGLAVPRARWALLIGAVSGLAAWAEPLVAAQSQYGLQQTSLTLAAILGVNGAALVPVALTLAIGLLLGLAGAWLGWAAQHAVPRSLRPVQKLRDQRLEVKDPVLTKS